MLILTPHRDKKATQGVEPACTHEQPAFQRLSSEPWPAMWVCSFSHPGGVHSPTLGLWLALRLALSQRMWPKWQVPLRDLECCGLLPEQARVACWMTAQLSPLPQVTLCQPPEAELPSWPAADTGGCSAEPTLNCCWTELWVQVMAWTDTPGVRVFHHVFLPSSLFCSEESN